VHCVGDREPRKPLLPLDSGSISVHGAGGQVRRRVTVPTLIPLEAVMRLRFPRLSSWSRAPMRWLNRKRLLARTKGGGIAEVATQSEDNDRDYSGAGLFADYQADAWPTLAQVRDLPPSLTGLGLDQPLAVILEATTPMDRQEVTEAMQHFCRSNPGEDGHLCQCTAMDIEGIASWVDELRADAHVSAEGVAAHRLMAVWTLQHHGPQMPFNGVPVGQYVERFSAYEF
jgi:hypothetical protein